jgi:hypothetical protein
LSLAQGDSFTASHQQNGSQSHGGVGFGNKVGITKRQL